MWLVRAAPPSFLAVETVRASRLASVFALLHMVVAAAPASSWQRSLPCGIADAPPAKASEELQQE